jgi:hypothetical protein
VIDPNAACHQDAGNQEASVARPWVLFAAHERDLVSLQSRLKALDAMQEERSAGELPIQHVSIGIVELILVRSTA